MLAETSSFGKTKKNEKKASSKLRSAARRVKKGAAAGTSERGG